LQYFAFWCRRDTVQDQVSCYDVGVKIEIDDEKWAGGAEVAWGCKLRSGEREPRMNANGREKAHPPSLRSYGATSRRDKKERNCIMTHGRDYTVLRGFSRCRLTGQRHGRGNDGRMDQTQNQVCKMFNYQVAKRPGLLLCSPA
jgi:hypothetical protein